jgi:hypothetical protein
MRDEFDPDETATDHEAAPMIEPPPPPKPKPKPKRVTLCRLCYRSTDDCVCAKWDR